MHWRVSPVSWLLWTNEDLTITPVHPVSLKAVTCCFPILPGRAGKTGFPIKGIGIHAPLYTGSFTRVCCDAYWSTSDTGWQCVLLHLPHRDDAWVMTPDGVDKLAACCVDVQVCSVSLWGVNEMAASWCDV